MSEKEIYSVKMKTQYLVSSHALGKTGNVDNLRIFPCLGALSLSWWCFEWMDVGVFEFRWFSKVSILKSSETSFGVIVDHEQKKLLQCLKGKKAFSMPNLHVYTTSVYYAHWNEHGYYVIKWVSCPSNINYLLLDKEWCNIVSEAWQTGLYI